MLTSASIVGTCADAGAVIARSTVTSAQQRKMAGMLRRLAELYELRVTAEGVETPQQLRYLQRIGCDWLQGNFLSLPLNRDQLVDLLDHGPLDPDKLRRSA